VQVREAKFHQLNEIAFVIHDQNFGRHAVNLIYSRAQTNTRRLKSRDEIETYFKSKNSRTSLRAEFPFAPAANPRPNECACRPGQRLSL
jgi:hypothetical protein